MNNNKFAPNFHPTTKPKIDEVPDTNRKDSLVEKLSLISQLGVMSLFFLVPIFFLPGLRASLGFDKTILTIYVGSIVLILLSFVALRLRRVQTVTPLPLLAFLVLIGVATASALGSGDFQDSLWGSVMEVQTVSFFIVLALAMALPLILQKNKSVALFSVLLFLLSGALILIYNAVRIFSNQEILSFGVFNSLTTSPIGGFNDLAILAGLITILGLLTLAQKIAIRPLIKSSVALIVVLATVILAVINFTNIWIVVGLVSLLLAAYLLSKDLIVKDNVGGTLKKPDIITFGAVGFVLLFSAVFIVGGDWASLQMNKITQVDYVEVLPSVEGTLGIAQSVYEEDPWLGVGPNRFADAWRLHKDTAINQTIFWDTDFQSGSGFTSTLFINLGLVGGLIYVIFNLLYLRFGYRLLIKNTKTDFVWYYIGSAAFVGSVFIWLMTYIYQPGQAILLIGALFTGLAFASAGFLLPEKVKQIPLITNQKTGFLVMFISVILISNIIVFLMSITNQYSAQSIFNRAQQGTSLEELDQASARAYEKFQDDRFASTRAQVQLLELNSLLALPQPTEDDQQEFLLLVEQAQIHANNALNIDDTNPDNHTVIAGIFRALAVAGVDGAKERALTFLEDASRLDPQNPGYNFVAAQMGVSVGDIELAREQIDQALELKPNFTEALFLLAQIDINEGNTEAAIATTRSMISLDPQNPSRYLQLGMLLLAEDRIEEAMQALRNALRLDPNFANARYILALAHIEQEEFDQALAELEIVRQTNPDNEQLLNLISEVESGEIETLPDIGLEDPVLESSPDTGSEDVNNPTGADSNLIQEINQTEADQPPSDEPASE